MMNSMNRAFTLAEVLITLGIIGVVAAMTIPTLINNANMVQYKSAYRKAYSTLTQATVSILNDNGGSFVNLCTAGYNNPGGSDCLSAAYAKYLNVNKSCAPGSMSSGGCVSSQIYGADGSTAFFSGWLNEIQNFSAGLLLSDGTSIAFEMRSPDCSEDIGGPLKRCGAIKIDINGPKKPNTLGKDIFDIGILSDRLSPTGSSLYPAPGGMTCPGGNYASKSQDVTTCAFEFLTK